MPFILSNVTVRFNKYVSCTEIGNRKLNASKQGSLAKAGFFPEGPGVFN